MSTSFCESVGLADRPIRRSDVRPALLEDDSPFGLQGLTRDTLRILKPNCIGRLAAALAVCGSPKEIRDGRLAAAILSARPDWQEEYQVVHLIEKSLWIDGHSDLVMTMTRDPSQIPDNPPPQILEALTLAGRLHPRSTIWYASPLFSDETNAEGLPLPLTASQVREEAQRRIAAAQRSALQMGWLYRAAYRTGQLPYAAWRLWRDSKLALRRAAHGVHQYFARARRDTRNRRRAKILAQSEYWRMGESFTKIPKHTTSLGLFTEHVGTSIRQTSDFVSSRVADLEGLNPVIAGAFPVAVHTITLTSAIAPILFTPVPIIVCDPFLFVELDDEPGKLRHLGHWYWQDLLTGEKKLHLHA